MKDVQKVLSLTLFFFFRFVEYFSPLYRLAQKLWIYFSSFINGSVLLQQKYSAMLFFLGEA